MRKKALRKDFYMEIRKSFGRFLSIFFIVAIGTAFFSGIRAAEPDMRLSGDLCDEPTGALDYNTGKAILKLLQEMCREKGMTVIVITHNSALAPMADRLIKIKNGKVSSMKVNENPISIDEIEW